MAAKKEWTFQEAEALLKLSLNALLYQAHTVHRMHFDPQQVQISTLLDIKTGRCPENCSYCPQSAHYNTGLQQKKLMDVEDVVSAARAAKAAGSTRFCMGAAWRGPHDRDLPKVCDMIQAVKQEGLETCVTLGLLKPHQADRLKEAGLDYYNHNIDTSEAHYQHIVTTRTFQDRLDTLQCVRRAGIKVCCGGILGMGETAEDRVGMLLVLANLDEPPESVPINQLIKIPGTPLEGVEDVDPFDVVRVIALARIMIPQARIRLSAGRQSMSDTLQALCFFAGVNSIFYGEKLLTAANAAPDEDDQLMERLGLCKAAETAPIHEASA